MQLKLCKDFPTLDCDIGLLLSLGVVNCWRYSSSGINVAYFVNWFTLDRR